MPKPDQLEIMFGRLPSGLKYILAAMGGAAGFNYALQHGSSVPVSCVVAGATVGLCLTITLLASARMLRFALLCVAASIVLNYALLIPFGYGDHMPAWIAVGQYGANALLRFMTHLFDQWQAGFR
jgi:hypothetical protein